MSLAIIKRPVITEKSVSLAASQNVYIFMVDRRATKLQVKAAIKELFGVDVISINTSTSYRVKKRTGRKRTPVMLAPVKKALVKIKAGQTIEAFDTGGQE